MNTPSVKLGKNIKCIREQKKMSQGDICRKLGFDRAYISNVEAGKGLKEAVKGGASERGGA